jgi:hypothetical protein
MNLFGGRRTIAPDQAERIKSWARRLWALPDETTVMVTELECREPGCPPIETVLAVLEGPGRTTQYNNPQSGRRGVSSGCRGVGGRRGAASCPLRPREPERQLLRSM